MHSTPVNIARPKLANSSFIISASPIGAILISFGRFLIEGKASAAVWTAPSGWPASSTSKVILRWRSWRSIWAGPLSSVSGRDVPQHHRPREPGTVSRDSNSTSCLASSRSRTMMGSCRSGRLSLASDWS